MSTLSLLPHYIPFHAFCHPHDLAERLYTAAMKKKSQRSVPGAGFVLFIGNIAYNNHARRSAGIQSVQKAPPAKSSEGHIVSYLLSSELFQQCCQIMDRDKIILILIGFGIQNVVDLRFCEGQIFRQIPRKQYSIRNGQFFVSVEITADRVGKIRCRFSSCGRSSIGSSGSCFSC